MHPHNESELYGVILAGGSGTRFWPKSREKKPKQLCALGGQAKTMIELTLDRLDGFIPADKRLIVTHQIQAPLTQEILGARCPVLIPEPAAKNTAAALALAALDIYAKNPQAVMVSLHADHIISPLEVFLDDVKSAVKIAQSGYLCLLGIPPTGPETGFGYIHTGAPLSGSRGFIVQGFKEKPTVDVAQGYLESGAYLWNSGLFVWRVDVFLQELAHYMPNTYQVLNQAHKQLNKPFAHMTPEELAPFYNRLSSVSIDHGVLEKSTQVAVWQSAFSWLDIGSWSALEEYYPTDAQGNLAFGDVLMVDTTNTTVDSDSLLVATLGVKDLVVVVAEGAVLVCPKNRAQDVKLIVEQLKALGRGPWT